MIGQYFELKREELKAVGVRDKYLKSKELINFCRKNNITTISEHNRKTILRGKKVIGEIINNEFISI